MKMAKNKEFEIEKIKTFLLSKIEEEGLKKFKTKTFFASSLGKSPGWLNNKLKGHRKMKIEDLILISEVLESKPGNFFPKENEINVDSIIECVQTIAEHTVKKYFENNKIEK
jgi:hypothetical protein